MRRSILLAFVAALALAIGLNTAASAGVGADAQATAKKKAAKKNCGKKKAKKKAGKSAADGSAAAKKKGKKKAACKPKKKAKAKPKGPTASFGDGSYADSAHNVEVEVSANGTQALVRPPVNQCMGGFPIQLIGPLAKKGSAYEASDTETPGGAGTIKWTLTVQSGLAYKLDTVYDIAFPDSDPCHDEVSIKGTLKKQ
jgi:hypothetical protein